MLYVNRMQQYSYITKLDTYEALTENVASLMKERIENQFQSLQVSADLVGKAGDMTKANIAGILPILANGSDYADLAIADMNGKGYNLAGDEINVGNENYFITALKDGTNASDKISYTAGSCTGHRLCNSDNE
jgi:hypothetical protein